MDILKSIDKNINNIKSILTASDIIFFNFVTAKNINCVAVFADGISNKDLIGEQIARPMLLYCDEITITSIKKHFTCPEIKEKTTIEDLVKEVLDGNTVLFIDGLDISLVFGLKTFDKRAVTEPPTATVIKGPREGFIEDIKTNMTLIRRKLKTPHLQFDMKEVGRQSKTKIAICYLDNIVKKGLVEKISQRIDKISIDGICDSSYISKYIQEQKYSLFKQIGNTEKPDILAAKILEGRVGIIIDGSPLILTVPYLLIEDFQSPEDYYASEYRAMASRIVRISAVLLAILLPAFFVAAQLFHLQLIPLNFLITIVNSIKGIPLSPSLEMFFTLLIFEILNEASIRMPKYVGMALSIVGALVLGDTAVRAGIVSTPTLLIMALSGICLYTVPDLVESMSILRIIFLFVAGSIGAFGIILCACYLLLYICSIDNYGTPILAPFAPIISGDMKDTFYKSTLQNMQKRPRALKSPNKTRLKKSKPNYEK